MSALESGRRLGHYEILAKIDEGGMGVVYRARDGKLGREVALKNETFPRGPVERAVLLETADMVAPDRVYSLYREIVSEPASLISMEVVCANPWTYPNLVKDPQFAAEVRRDGRFVEFLERYGWM